MTTRPPHAEQLAPHLEDIFRRFHRKAYIHPDPLEFLYRWKDVKEREIVGLVASSLAYGRVLQILKSVSVVLDTMGPSPYRYVTRTPLKIMAKDFSAFRHRFADGCHLSALLFGIGRVIRKFGSIEACLAQGMATCGSDPWSGLVHLYEQLTCGRKPLGHLLADPHKTSACKRLHLYLRWMVRSDAIDPGGWRCISPASLIVPLDTHMFAIGRRLGFTRRRQADRGAALEITDGFRAICPCDPVRFDFSLSRLGIRQELTLSLLP